MTAKYNKTYSTVQHSNRIEEIRIESGFDPLRSWYM